MIQYNTVSAINETIVNSNIFFVFQDFLTKETNLPRFGYSAPMPVEVGYSAPMPVEVGYSAPMPVEVGYPAPMPVEVGYPAPMPVEEVADVRSGERIESEKLMAKKSVLDSAKLDVPEKKSPTLDDAIKSIIVRLLFKDKEETEEKVKPLAGPLARLFDVDLKTEEDARTVKIEKPGLFNTKRTDSSLKSTYRPKFQSEFANSKPVANKKSSLFGLQSASPLNGKYMNHQSSVGRNGSDYFNTPVASKRNQPLKTMPDNGLSPMSPAAKRRLVYPDAELATSTKNPAAMVSKPVIKRKSSSAEFETIAGTLPEDGLATIANVACMMLQSSSPPSSASAPITPGRAPLKYQSSGLQIGDEAKDLNSNWQGTIPF